MSGVSLSDINHFLSRHGETYVYVLNRVKRVLTDFAQSMEGRHLVYRIATRADYQQGQELKTAESAVAKLYKRRQEYGPEYSLEDIEDFVGLSVVCVYPSDVDRVVEWVKEMSRPGEDLKIPYTKKPDWPSTDEPKDERGYRAHHFVLTLQDPIYDPFRCEVQVRTILHEAWARMTHDIIYKSKYRRHAHQKKAEALSGELSVLDQQSEGLKVSVAEIEKGEEALREAARLALMSAVTTRLSKRSPRLRVAAAKVMDQIRGNESRLRRDPPAEVLDRIRSYISSVGVDSDICMALGYLASLRDDDDLDQLADFYLGQFGRGLQGKDKVQSCLYKSTIYFCLGSVEPAREAAEEALGEAQRVREPKLTAKCKANLAYFLAELERDERRARELAREAVEVLEQVAQRSEDAVAALDTLGYVEIVFGKTKKEIKAGLRKCAKAAPQFPEPAVALKFLDVHKRRATTRLEDLG